MIRRQHSTTSRAYRISQQPQHVLNDTVRLVVNAGNAKLRPLPTGDYALDDYEGLSTAETHQLLKSAVQRACVCSVDAPKAVECLRSIYRAEYYGGLQGKARLYASFAVNTFKFECSALSAELDALSKSAAALPSAPAQDIPKLPVPSRPVFSGNVRDLSLLGAIQAFSYRPYEVVWMSPQQYLRQVDPDFTRHLDEDSMPRLLTTMAAIASGKKDARFAPLMMNPKNRFSATHGGPRMEHEGRHRALAACWLQIASVPVAIG